MQANEVDDHSSDVSETLSLLRLVQFGILVSLFWKIQFYWASLGVNREFPLVDSFFPEFFRSQTVLMAAYLVAVTSSLLSLFGRSRWQLLPLSILSVVGLSILCIHQSSYNDVTFLTCAWSSLWCLWLTSRLGESFRELYPRAAWLSHLILSLIFLGAATGKLTSGYWSGEVLHEIYFKGRNFWTYNLMRESMSEESLRIAATWHSRAVIILSLIHI